MKNQTRKALLLVSLLTPFIAAFGTEKIGGTVNLIVKNVGQKNNIEFLLLDSNIPAGGQWERKSPPPKLSIVPGKQGSAVFSWTVDDLNNQPVFGRAFSTYNGYEQLLVEIVGNAADSPFGFNATMDSCTQNITSSPKIVGNSVQGTLTVEINCDPQRKK